MAIIQSKSQSVTLDICLKYIQTYIILKNYLPKDGRELRPLPDDFLERLEVNRLDRTSSSWRSPRRLTIFCVGKPAE